MPFIPSKDADVVNWGLNFSTLLTADPPRYGTDAAAALLIQTEFDAFSAAYTLAVDPGTRTPATVAHKDGTKSLFLHDARALAALIRPNQGVDAADKIALGLTIPDPVPTPVPTPTSAPVLSLVGIAATTHTCAYADELTPTTKKKPTGVIGMCLYRSIAVAAQTVFDTANAVHIANCTKSPFVVDVPGGNTGKVATYWGRWFTRNGKFGPLSAPRSVVCP